MQILQNPDPANNIFKLKVVLIPNTQKWDLRIWVNGGCYNP